MIVLVLTMALIAVATSFTPRAFGSRAVRATITGPLDSTTFSPPNVDTRIRQREEFVSPLPERVLELISVTDSDFDDKVMNQAGLSVVLFTSAWCSPCQDMKREIVSKCMPKHSSKARFFVVDTDYNTEAVAEFGVRSIPSTILFKDGAVVSDIVGNVDLEILNQQIIKNF